MEHLAVDVVLYNGDEQTFSQGRSWRLPPSGVVEVLNVDGEVIAVVADGRWAAVGYRYTAPVIDKPVPNRPKKLSLAQRLTGRA